MAPSTAIAAPIPEPTLADVIRLFWRARRIVTAGGIAGLLAGFLFMALAVPQYRATMLVAPATHSATSDLAAEPAPQSSFATDYMLKSFSAGDAADFTLFEHIVEGPSVAGVLLKDPMVRNGVAQDKGFRLQWRKVPETPEDLSAYLETHLAVEPVGGTPIRRLVYLHPDRDFAKLMLETLYASTDGLIRTDMRAKADRRVVWLQRTIAETQNPDYRRALTALLTDQEQMRMMLALDEPYAAQVAEPASVTVRPVWPRAVFVLPVFTAIGLMLGMVMFSVRRALASL